MDLLLHRSAGREKEKQKIMRFIREQWQQTKEQERKIKERREREKREEEGRKGEEGRKNKRMEKKCNEEKWILLLSDERGSRTRREGDRTLFE